MGKYEEWGFERKSLYLSGPKSFHLITENKFLNKIWISFILYTLGLYSQNILFKFLDFI